MAKKSVGKRVEDDPRYHDTWRLLKKYRDVVWSLELSVQQLKKQFEVEYGSSIEDFLESIYLAGADLGGTQIEDHARCIERSHKMLSLLNHSVDTVIPAGSARPVSTIASAATPRGMARRVRTCGCCICFAMAR